MGSRFEYLGKRGLPRKGLGPVLGPRPLAHFSAAISSEEKSFDGSLAPLHPYPWPLGYTDLPCLYPDRLLKNRACVVEVFQAMGGRARGQEMRAHLREDVARQRES